VSTAYRDQAEAIVEALHESVWKLDEYDFTGYETKEGKGGTDKVTQADKNLQKVLIKFFRREFPETGIIAEEDGDQIKKKDRNFIIDPIDGTASYEIGRDYFCTSIAYQEDGEVVVGGIASSKYKRGIISIGIKGEGAWCETRYDFEKTQETDFEEVLEEITASERIQADSGHEKLNSSAGMVEATSVQDIEGEMSEIRKSIDAKYIQPGSAALELVEIARGTLDFRVDTIDIWDFAAGHLIVEEAGGETLSTEYYSKSLDRDLIFTVAAGKGIMEKIKPMIQDSKFMGENA
jgi:fructose-1,6-bisphosphatase/inositol monophosphatase family enzyme